MISVGIRLSLILIVLNLLTPCSALRSSRGYSGGKYDKGYKDQGNPKTFVGTSSGIPSQNPTRRGLGISAWGIVVLILTLILAGMGFYYFSLCYPIICKKKNTYDMMELPTMATMA